MVLRTRRNRPWWVSTMSPTRMSSTFLTPSAVMISWPASRQPMIGLTPGFWPAQSPDADILDVLDAVGGDDLLAGEQAADDRLDPVLLAGQVEVDGAEQLTVVGHGQGGHAHAGGLGEQVVDPGGPVEHRVLGVHMEVREAARHDCCRSPYRFVAGPAWTGVSHSLWTK